MADSNGIPVVSGLFQIIKAPFKLVKSLGETGLAALNADGKGTINGFKGMGNSIFDVGEGTFSTVDDVAGAGKNLFNALHFEEESEKENETTSRVTRLIPRKDMYKDEEVKIPDSPVTSPIEKIELKQEETIAPIVVKSIDLPVNKVPQEQNEEHIPPVVDEPAAPPVGEIPQEQEEFVPPVVDEQIAPSTDDVPIAAAPVESAPVQDSNSKTKTILKYAAITVGVVLGAVLLKKAGKGLLQLFSKSKKDPMIDHSALYEALKGKPTPVLKAHQTVAGTVGKVAPDPITAETLLKTGADNTQKAISGPATTPLLPAPSDNVTKAGEKLATPKSPVCLTDKYAALGDKAPKQVHNIGKEEVAKLTEKANNKLYKEKVTKEVKEQVKARAKKAAEEAAKKAQGEAAKKAAEEAAKKAQEATAKKAAEEAAKKAQEEAAKKAAREAAKAERAAANKAAEESYRASRRKIAEQLKADKLAVKTEIKDIKLSISEMTKEKTMLQKKSVLTIEEASRKQELTRLIKNAKAKLETRQRKLAKLMGKKVTIAESITVQKEKVNAKKATISAKVAKQSTAGNDKKVVNFVRPDGPMLTGIRYGTVS